MLIAESEVDTIKVGYQRKILDKIILSLFAGNLIGLVFSIFRQTYISLSFTIGITISVSTGLFLLYFLNREGHYYFAANVVVTIASFSFYIILFNVRPAEYSFMIFLLLSPILISLVLLEVKETLIYFGLIIVSILIFPSLPSTETTLVELAPPLINFIFLGLVILVLIYYQDFIDSVKQRRLTEKEAELNLKNEELRQGQKLEAIGRLAGGIAHDFNNILSVILGYIDLTLLEDEDIQSIHRDLHEIRKAGEKGKSLIDQLLVFSRKKVQEVKSLEMNHIIEDLYLILDKLVGGTISLKLELDSNELYFKCDTTQINQVVMNLVQNARDAIEQSGVISIRTYAEVREEDNSLLQYVVLEVEDTGTGISAEDMVHIYEPFYTTKDQGKGTGLGLSMVYGVVTQYDGVIEVDTELGRGTLFKIYFPLTPAPRATSESILPGIHKSSRTEGKVILVVEDDNQVRSMMDKVLTASGYNVISAVNGKEAQSICDDLSIHIDLMITDIVMPQMNGTDLALYSTYKRPNMQILLISGYPESDLFEHSTGDLNLEELPYLKKPFSSEELLARLQSMISLSREV